MRKMLLPVALLLAMVMLLVACGGDQTVTTQAPANTGEGSAQGTDTTPAAGAKDLKMAITASETSAWYAGAEVFKEMVEKGTEGRYTVSLYPNEQLASGDQVRGVEMIYTGETDLDMHSTIIHSNVDERFAAFSMPFMYADLDDVDARLINNESAKEALFNIVRENGAVPLGISENGFRQLTNSKRAIHSPDDMSLLKVRVPGMSMYLDLFSALGADPTAMAWGEVYTALQQGTIDGQENPLDTIKSNNVEEVQNYLTIWNYSYDPILFTASQQLWDELSEEDKQVFLEAGEVASAEQRKITRARGDELMKLFEEKLEVNTLTPEEREVFREKLGDFNKQYEEKFGREFLESINFYQ